MSDEVESVGDDPVGDALGALVIEAHSLDSAGEQFMGQAEAEAQKEQQAEEVAGRLVEQIEQVLQPVFFGVRKLVSRRRPALLPYAKAYGPDEIRVISETLARVAVRRGWLTEESVLWTWLAEYSEEMALIGAVCMPAVLVWLQGEEGQEEGGE
jgi:hypothetical protein